MALIKCPECGKEVSDSAKICPECGYKLKKSSINKKILFKIVILFIVVITIGVAGTQFYKIYQAKQEELLNKQLQEETAKAVEAMIDNLESLDVPSDMIIDEIYNLYNSLDEDIKAKVSNFDKMKTIERENTISKFNEAVKRLDFDEADMLLAEISDTLNESEKEELLKTYGEWYCFAYAENNLIQRMKNPNSYSRNGGSCSYLSLIEPNSDIFLYDNEYMVTIEIDYMGTNSFGGYVTQTYKEPHYFVIDIDTMSIKNVMSGSERVAKMVDLRMTEREKSAS